MSGTEEESNFLRFYFLNLKVASKAVRVYFDSIHPPAGLSRELIKNDGTLKKLHFMTKLQLDILYPNPGQTGTSADFDTTLIVCLLRNLPPFESAPVTGWDNLPHPGDTSTGADLARIKLYRNKVAHCKDGKLSSTKFSQFWGDLEGAIGRIGGASLLIDAQSVKQDYTSGGRNQRRIEEDTRALIEEDVEKDTFVSTKAVTDGLLLLKQNGVLLITGYAGTGKSRIGRHVLHKFCSENESFKCMKLTLAEWDNMTNKKEKDSREENMDNLVDNFVLLFDDIFGATYCIFNRENFLDTIYAYVCKGNIKVIITIRDTVKRHCQEMFESHRLFQFDFIDLSSKNYLLSYEEKQTILMKYMKIDRLLDFSSSKGFSDCNGETVLDSFEILKIIKENPVKGFPLVVYQFVKNDKYFKRGSKFFDRPTEAMLEEMNAIRRKGEDQRNFMIQYAVMVYTAINENCIKLDDNLNITAVSKISDAIYGEKGKIKKCHILDAINELKGSYLIKIPNQRSYRFHHQTLQESVILSFAQEDEENIKKIIPLISFSFFLKMVKPKSYKEKDEEVVLMIPTNSFQLLADRLVDIYIADFSIYHLDTIFLYNFSNTEMFQQEYCHLLPSMIEALEREDHKDKYTENMIRSVVIDTFDYVGSNVHIKNTDLFFCLLT